MNTELPFLNIMKDDIPQFINDENYKKICLHNDVVLEKKSKNTSYITLKDFEYSPENLYSEIRKYIKIGKKVFVINLTPLLETDIFRGYYQYIGIANCRTNKRIGKSVVR
jgi:hypothetical protein